MNLRETMDDPNRQRIRSVRHTESAVEVTFADGLVASVSDDWLVKDREADWSTLHHDGHSVSIATDEVPLEVSWLSGRATADPELKADIESAAADEARMMGAKLRALRLSRGLTSREVARQAHISPQSLSRIENGRHGIVLSTLQRILRVLDYTLADLTIDADEDDDGAAHQSPRERSPQQGEHTVITRRAATPEHRSEKRLLSTWLLAAQPDVTFPSAGAFQDAFRELVRALIDTQDVWPTFDIRMLLDKERVVHYALIQGTFHTTTRPLALRLATPEVFAARLPAKATLRGLLLHWAEGRPARLNGQSLRLPDRFGYLDGRRGNLYEGGHFRSLSTRDDEFAVEPIVGWHFNAYSHQPSNEDTALFNSFVSAASRSGWRAEEFALHHLGRALLGVTGPIFDVVLPLPIDFRATVDEEDLVVRLVLRQPYSHDEFWAAASAGPWDLDLERHNDWMNLGTSDDGWTVGALRIAGAALPPHVTVWTGRSNDPELAFNLAVPPRGAQAQKEKVLYLLYDYSTTSLLDALTPPSGVKGHKDRATVFEVTVANLLEAAGYGSYNLGAPVKAEGIDLLAFHHHRQEALLVSITVGNGLEAKLRGLLNRRRELTRVLSAWSCRSLVVTSVPRSDVAPGDLRDCTEAGVAVLTGDDLKRLAAGQLGLTDALDVALREPVSSELPPRLRGLGFG